MTEIVKRIRFIHLLTLLVAGSVMIFDIMLAFHKVPAENKSNIDFITGFLNGTVFAGALAYWYNSTAGSKDKSRQIEELAKKVTPGE